MRSWWRRRSLRARLTFLSVIPLTLALVAGTVAVVAIFTSSRIHDLDRQTLSESQALVGLVSTAQLPNPLPVPAGSPLFAQVIDSAGTVLDATAGASRVLALTETGATPRFLGKRTDELSSYAGVPLRLRVTPVALSHAQVYVVVAAPLADVRKAHDALRLVLYLVVPVLSIVGGSLAWVVIGLSLSPVERLRAAAASLADSPSSQLLPGAESPDEIGRLAETLNELLRRLNAAIALQRNFVADAAHELRSPLASIRVQLDVASRHPELSEMGELTAGLSAEVDRLTAITDDLLLLARLESKQALRTEPVDLSLLAGCLGPEAIIRADRDSMQGLIRNLVENAQRYADHVEVSTELAAGAVHLFVDDDGPGIAAADRRRVFDRWVRLDQSRTRDAGGTGLGLALVREIAEAHGGSVEILDSPLGGARLHVTLPSAIGSDSALGSDAEGL